MLFAVFPCSSEAALLSYPKRMNLLELAKELLGTLQSPESYKPMPAWVFWTVVAMVVGFFAVFGWLYITGRIG